MFKKLFKKIANWFTGGSKSSSSGRSSSSRSGGSSGGGGGGRYDRTTSGGSQYGMSKSYKRALAEKQKQERERKKKVAKAFKAGGSSSTANDAFKKEAITQYQANAKKAAEAKKKPTPYQAYQQKKRDEAKAFHARTNNRYNTQVGTAEERAKARQRLKMGMYQEDPDVAKFDTDYNKYSQSFARGALSGATFGLSELMAAKAPRTDASREAEDYYQKNKSKAAEFGGEIVGSLAGFGLTGSLTKEAAGNAAKKILPVDKIATSKLVQKAARRQALKTVGATATEGEIARIARAKAIRLVEALGEDAAINLTTGAISDISHAIVDSDDPAEFVRNMAVSAGANVLLGGATTAIPELYRTAQPAINAVGAGIDSTLDAAGRKLMDNTGSLAMTIGTKDVDDIDDALIEAATTPEDFMEFFGLSRPMAELLAEDKAKQAARQAAETAAEAAAPETRGIPKGNIKGLAENLRTNEFLPRQSTTQQIRAPRSAKRVDTSVEGLTKNLDELKKQKPQTDKEKRALQTKINEVEERLNRAKWRKEGGADMAAMRKAYKGEYKGFDMGKYTNSYQGDVLEGKVKGKTATIVEMSPDEYIERTYRQIFKKPTEKSKSFANIAETKKNISKYAKAMKDGEKFPLPYLDYTTAGQEGRHRALAAKEAGIEKIPVVIIDDANNPKAIIEEVKEATTKAEAPKVETPKASDDVSRLAAVNDDSMKVGIQPDNKVKKAEKALKEKSDKTKRQTMPKGEKLTKAAKKKFEGSFEETVTPPTYEEVKNATKKYLKGQKSEDTNVISRAGTSFLNATTDDDQRAVVKAAQDSGMLNYNRVNNRQKYEAAVKEFVDNKETVGKKMLEWSTDIDKIPQSQTVDAHYQAWAVAQMMRNHINDSPEAKRIYSAAVSVTQQLSSMAGQTNQFQRVMVHCDPRTRFENALDNIATNLLDSRGFVNRTPELKGKNRFQRRAAIKEMLLNNEEVSKALENVYNATTAEEYGDAMAEVLLASYTLDHRTVGDVINEWRYLAMLGNPKTHIRNILGSALFRPIRGTSNIIRSVLEDSALVRSKAGDIADDIVKTGAFSSGSTSSEGGKAAAKAFNDRKKEILGSLKYEEATARKGGNKTPIGKFFSALSEFNSAALSKEDDFFRTSAYKRQYAKSYNEYLKKGVEITEALEEKIHSEALRESQISTFNEWNEFASAINKYLRRSRRADATALQRAGGIAVNTALPFTKVPANILKQSMNYSPAGLFKGYSNIVKAGKTGDRELLNKAIDEFASGLTGTGIMGLGLGFGMATDRFTTNVGKDDAAAKHKKNQGFQNYSVRIGDHTYTLDWMTPVASTFFMGVELANQLKDTGGMNLFDLGASMSQITSRVIDPVLETSMLSGLYNIVESTRNGKSKEDETLGFAAIVMRELVQNYVNSLIPTLQGQAARTFAYDSDKMIPMSGDTEYWINATKVKLGLADTNILTEALGADTDAYGNVKNKKNTTKDYAEAAFRNFISPSNIQKIDWSDLDQKKVEQYERMVKSGVDPQEAAYLFPKKQYKKDFDVGNMEVKMSNKDLSTYNQAKTKGGEEGMRYILENYMFNEQEVGADGKKQPSANALTLADKAKLMKQFKGKSLREVEEWLVKQPQFKNASEADQKKAIEGLWSYSKQGRSNAAKRVGEQAVVKAQGKDVNEYNFNNEITKKKREVLQPLIDNGIVSYEEAVDFARYAGKTYYYEGEDGEAGHSQTYYNKAEMMEYLESKGYSPEKAAALYNAFKQWNAKEYGAPSNRRYYRRRRYRRYYRRRHGGRGRRVPVGEIKTSAFKAKKVTPPKFKSAIKSTQAKQSNKLKVKGTGAKGSSTNADLAAALRELQKTEKKVAPPKPKGGSK